MHNVHYSFLATRNSRYVSSLQNGSGQSPPNFDFRETEQPPSYHLLVDYEVTIGRAAKKTLEGPYENPLRFRFFDPSQFQRAPQNKSRVPNLVIFSYFACFG